MPFVFNVDKTVDILSNSESILAPQIPVEQNIADSKICIFFIVISFKSILIIYFSHLGRTLTKLLY